MGETETVPAIGAKNIYFAEKSQTQHQRCDAQTTTPTHPKCISFIRTWTMNRAWSLLNQWERYARGGLHNASKIFISSCVLVNLLFVVVSIAVAVVVVCWRRLQRSRRCRTKIEIKSVRAIAGTQTIHITQSTSILLFCAISFPARSQIKEIPYFLIISSRMSMWNFCPFMQCCDSRVRGLVFMYIVHVHSKQKASVDGKFPLPSVDRQE